MNSTHNWAHPSLLPATIIIIVYVHVFKHLVDPMFMDISTFDLLSFPYMHISLPSMVIVHILSERAKLGLRHFSLCHSLMWCRLLNSYDAQPVKHWAKYTWIHLWPFPLTSFSHVAAIWFLLTLSGQGREEEVSKTSQFKQAPGSPVKICDYSPVSVRCM